jgi:hypothetical protein
VGVRIAIKGPDLVVEMTGADVLWSLKKRVSVPRSAVVDVHVEPEPWRMRMGLRWPGTGVPRVIAAGTFYGKLGKSFLNFRRGPAVAIELVGARYDRIVVQIPYLDATEAAAHLRKALRLDAF